MYESEMKKLVLNYLEDIKKELPWWIKTERMELNKVLEQLETHIWEKAEDISEYDHPTEDSVQLALAHMGSPEHIAQEFEQGKTPKIFIRTDLWPIFKGLIIIFFFTTIILNLFGVFNLVSSFIRYPLVEPIDIFSNNPLGFLDEEKLRIFFINTYINIGLFGGFGCITIFFFWLSKRGYYQDRVKNYKKRLKLEKLYEKNINNGMSVLPKTGEPVKLFLKNYTNFFIGIVSLLWIIIALLSFSPNQYQIIIYFYFGVILLILLTTFIVEAWLGYRHVISHQIVLLIELSVYMLIGVLILIDILRIPDSLLEAIWKVIYLIIFSIYFLFLPMITFYQLKKLEEYRLTKMYENYNN